MDRFPADLYDVGNSDRCPFGALSVLCSGLLSGESARNSEGLGGWTSQSWGNVGYNHRHLFYSKRVSHRSMLWTFDKLVVPTGLVAAMIRLGNLMNHEIYGHPTDLPWGFRFIENLHAWKRGAAPVFTAPSHPTQLYEAASYLVTFVICMWLYFKKMPGRRRGLSSVYL